MNTLLTTDNGGLPFVLDDLRWALGQSESDSGIYQALNTVLRFFGDDFIVYGCDVTGDDISEGWIMLGGELLKVDAHTKSSLCYAKVTTYETAGSKTFQNGTTVDTYQKDRGVCNAGSGNLAYNGYNIAGRIRIHTTIQDRGDPSDFDFIYTDLDHDNVWHVLDLSSVVPTGYHWVLVRVFISGVGSASQLIGYLRESGNTNEVNAGVLYKEIGMTNASQDFWIKLLNQQIDYKFSIGSYNARSIVIRGWI